MTGPATRLRVELPVILSIGSNLGDREAALRAAVAALRAIAGVRVDAASSIVETAALKLHGVDTEAPAYLNAAVAIRTALAPQQLLAELARIEHEQGRKRAERWGDRSIDIDIVWFGGLRVDTDSLTIPHPRAAERVFVLAPWLELQPDATLPPAGADREPRRIDGLLAALDEPVRRYPADALL